MSAPTSRSPLPVIERLSAIASGYDALFCDAWGVIHDGVAVFEGVAEALTRFRRTRGPVVILTNAPRPSSIIPAQLDRLGLPRAAYDAVVTSGDAVRAEISARLPAPAFRLGPEKDDALYHGLAIDFAPLEEARFVICTGLVDDARETPEDYRALLEAMAARALPMICANPDIVVRWGGRLIYCAGALAQIYEALGGAVVYGGKPHRPIYDLAMKRVAGIGGRAIAPARILAIGDGVKTDIAGANAQGLGAVFVAGAGGVHDGAADAAGETLALSGVEAVAVMESLKW
ncbi:MAG: TIGR01459 family HAD-type hydrolase [Amphiplicatus sp.]